MACTDRAHDIFCHWLCLNVIPDATRASSRSSGWSRSSATASSRVTRRSPGRPAALTRPPLTTGSGQSARQRSGGSSPAPWRSSRRWWATLWPPWTMKTWGELSGTCAPGRSSASKWTAATLSPSSRNTREEQLRNENISCAWSCGPVDSFVMFENWFLWKLLKF